MRELTMTSWFILLISVVAGVIAIVVWAGVLIIYRRLRPQVCIRTGNVEIHPKILSKSTLNWSTFIDGIDRLKEQLVHSGPRFIPDLFAGVNLGGAVAAAILNSENKPMAIFRVETRSGEREIIYSAFPRLLSQIEKSMVLSTLFSDSPERVNVLLVDEEFKTGSSARVVIDYLSTEWGIDEKNIRVAVFALAEVKVKYSRLFRETITIDESNSILFPRVNFSSWKNKLKDKLLFISYLSSATVSFPWEE